MVADATDVLYSTFFSLFNDRPNMKLDEAMMATLERFDTAVDPRTISNILLRHKWSRKSAKVADENPIGHGDVNIEGSLDDLLRRLQRRCVMH